MRLGLFGGSFDPPHLGHLHVARLAQRQLALERVRLIPAARPPHKLARVLADAPARRAMLELLRREEPWLEVDGRELERGGTSFTYDTLVALRAELGAAAHELYFLIGSDSLVDLPGWHRAAELVELATIVTVPRDPESLVRGRATVRALLPHAADRILAHVLEGAMLPVSSSRIRADVAAGRPIDDQVPPAIADYIARNGLYGADARSAPD